MEQSKRPLKVYIIYSRENSVIKDRIYKYLEQFSYSLISGEIDNSTISSGKLSSQEMLDVISMADVVLFLVSKSSLLSEIMLRELEMQKKNKGDWPKYIIPIMIEPCELQGTVLAEFPALPLGHKTMLDYKTSDVLILQIVRALDSINSIVQNSTVRQMLNSAKQGGIKVLDLSSLGLEFIPWEIRSMPDLKELVLNGNDIQTLEYLDNLPQLEVLRATGNRIKKIENLETLVNLHELDLQHNNINKIEGIDQLQKLKILGLSNNSLESLSGIATLPELETVYAAHNKIDDIEELASTSKLLRIILTNNQIKSLKPIIHYIKKNVFVKLSYSFTKEEQGIFIADNTTLAEPSLETVQKGNEAILKYFEDVDSFGQRKLEVLKLIIVGNSGVGKTNFSQFLRGLPISNDHESTHMLDIQSFDADFLKSDDGKPMRVNIFDFGGQDYYHDSHRMFYSHDTAYVLIWDTPTNKYSEEVEKKVVEGMNSTYENFPLEYWLECVNYNLAGKHKISYKKKEEGIEIKSNGAPIFVLQNKIDIAEGRLNQQLLSKKYENLSGFFGVSILNSRRTKVLLEVLDDYFRTLNLSGRMLVTYEHKIIQDYLSNPRPFAIHTLEDFRKDCIKIIADKTVDFNITNAIIVAETLNAIGAVYYHKKSETDGLVFTDIKELNERIKAIMSIAKKQNKSGIFTKEELAAIKDKDAILDLLTQNRSIILLSDTQFLAPQFLPAKPDPSVEFFLYTFRYLQLRYIYTAYFHKSLLLALFAKYLGQNGSAEIEVKKPPFWRDGIIITKGEGSTKEMVLVEFLKDEQQGTINIKTMSPYNKNGLEREIENTLEELNKGWTVCKQISVNGKDFFDVSYLKDEVHNMRYEFFRNGSLFTVNDFKHIIDFEKVPKKLFISYSSKNAEFIKRFVTHLEILKSSGMIDPWYDRMIESGTKWDDSIRKEMYDSDIIIFLLSPDFLATEYIMKTELPLAMKQLQTEKSKFFFIELQPCGWKRTAIANYQQTDDPTIASKNIIEIGKPDNDEAWNKVVDALEEKMKE